MNSTELGDNGTLPEGISNIVSSLIGKIGDGENINQQDLEFLRDDTIALKYQDTVAVQLIGSTSECRLQFHIATQIIRNTLGGYSYSDLITLMYISRLFPDSLKYYEDIDKFLGPPRDRLAIENRTLIAITLGLSIKPDNSGNEIQASNQEQIGKILG